MTTMAGRMTIRMMTMTTTTMTTTSGKLATKTPATMMAISVDPEKGQGRNGDQGRCCRGGRTACGRAARARAEAADGSDASEGGAENKEIEDVAAETVETPTAVVAALPPQVTDVVSSDHVQHLRLLEALLFAGTQALDEKELADRLPNDADLPRLLADLAELYANRGINLVKVAGGMLSARRLIFPRSSRSSDR